MIAFQGEPGAYSEAAAQLYSPNSQVMPCRSFEDVFAAVANGRASRGILPMENSVGGSIHRNYDLLVEHELPIVGEVELAVDHCLLGRRGSTLADIRMVYSHPQALAQCEEYLRSLDHVSIVAVYDTAGGAKMVADGSRADAGAIASRRAADLFGLEVLADGVQDYASNLTRFVLISRSTEHVADANKTSLVFALKSTPGSLFRALSCFALRDINLTKLESRPMRGRPWEYLFYVEVDARRDDLGCARALTHLAEFAKWTRILGSYKGAERKTAT
jgi:arogenate/prephenate dehydratase